MVFTQQISNSDDKCFCNHSLHYPIKKNKQVSKYQFRVASESTETAIKDILEALLLILSVSICPLGKPIFWKALSSNFFIRDHRQISLLNLTEIKRIS